jgi:hypothetical protein
VGEIQPGHVHAQAHKVAQDLFRIARWTDGANDLCPAIRATNVGGSRQCIYGRPGILRQRLSFFQICPNQNLCRSNYCIWRKLRQLRLAKSEGDALGTKGRVRRRQPFPLSRMSGAAFWLFIFLGSDNLSQAADRNRFLIHSAPHPLRECGAPVGTTMHGEDNAQRATIAEILRWQAFASRPAPPQHDRGNYVGSLGTT